MTPDDITPEATRVVIHREAPGLAEAMRAEGARHTPLGILTRGIAGIAESTLIVNFPGSPKAVEQLFPVIAPVLAHAVQTLRGDSSHGHRHGGGGGGRAGGSGARYGERVALRDVTLRCRPARRWPCSGRTAPARRRCCGSSPALLRPHAGHGAVLGAELPREATACAGGSACSATSRCSTAT